MRPIAVCISDIHFSLATLDPATAALESAIAEAESFNVPLIIAGDLQNDKAIVRGEIANRLIQIFNNANCYIYIIVGNHDMINEKGEENALNYLQRDIIILIRNSFQPNLAITFIPYCSTPEKFRKEIRDVKTPIAIVHQGFKGAAMGDYAIDNSSVDVADIPKGVTVISGHYHRHQTIGPVTYIGSPYTITYGEANDGPKGFLVLYEDGSFKRVITCLRKHIIIEGRCKNNQMEFPLADIGRVNKNDLVWFKLYGSRSELDSINRRDLVNLLPPGLHFKFDKIETESGVISALEKMLTDEETMDAIIDKLPDHAATKIALKSLWRTLV